MKRFFKTQPGEYGEEDQFWGISVPQQRVVAKAHWDISLEFLDQLIADPIHECRLTGLFILVAKFNDQYARKMPRTMLRYSIEKLSPNLRKAYLAR